MKLFDYQRSTASYRVRIALNLKGISYETNEISLLDGQQHSTEYKTLNPQGLVPTLLDGEQHISQSLAIIEYLDRVYPNPILLPEDAKLAAKVRSFAYVIACEMHPLNNLRVLHYLKDELGIDEPKKLAWYHHWLKLGFNSLEQMLTNNQSPGPFCFGDVVSLADICLIPQVFNANRFNFDMSNYPKLLKVNEHCLTLTTFKQASPER